MNRDQISQLSFDCVLPAAIFFNEKLEPNCIKLYAMVRNLSKIEGYCFATNDYLARLLDCDISSIKRWISSLREQGYLEIQIKQIGIQTSRKIFLSDKFKKCLRQLNSAPPPAQNCAPPSSEMSHIKDPYKKEEYKKEESISCPRSETDAETPQTKPPSGQKIEEKAYEVAKKLLGKVLEIHPKFKAPKIDSWAKEIDLAVRRDSRTYEELEAVIEYAFKDRFWKTRLQSADGLRRNFDKLWGNILDQSSPIEKNKILVMRAKRNLISQGVDAKDMYLSIQEGCVIRLDKGTRIPLELEPQEFKYKFMEAFELYV